MHTYHILYQQTNYISIHKHICIYITTTYLLSPDVVFRLNLCDLGFMENMALPSNEFLPQSILVIITYMY